MKPVKAMPAKHGAFRPKLLELMAGHRRWRFKQLRTNCRGVIVFQPSDWVKLMDKLIAKKKPLRV